MTPGRPRGWQHQQRAAPFVPTRRTVLRSQRGALQEQLRRLIAEADVLARAIGDAVKDARRALLGTAYARLRREPEPGDPSAGTLARALRDRRLSVGPVSAVTEGRPWIDQVGRFHDLDLAVEAGARLGALRSE